MPCYSPLQAWRGVRGVSGKRSMVFNRRDAALPGEIFLPCGQCVGCRLERSRQWALRCLHESSLYRRNCFLTLTLDAGHMPADGSVDVRTFQLFMKRLRKAYPGDRIRYFHCGEYGEKLGRPHYHACLFNFDFDDKYIWSVKNGFNLYRSPSLEKVWGLGHCLVGEVTFESAAYVARYVMKKITGEDAQCHYNGKRPEYVTMSRRPGIGKGWFQKWKGDVYPDDFIVVRGVKMKPPRFYDSLMEAEDPAFFADLKRKRILKGTVPVPAKWFKGTFREGKDSSPLRLVVKEEVKRSQIKSLRRSLEDGLEN